MKDWRRHKCDIPYDYYYTNARLIWNKYSQQCYSWKIVWYKTIYFGWYRVYLQQANWKFFLIHLFLLITFMYETYSYNKMAKEVKYRRKSELWFHFRKCSLVAKQRALSCCQATSLNSNWNLVTCSMTKSCIKSSQAN